MPDPHALYVVTSVVVFGLVAWVAYVLVRAPVRPPPPTVSSSGAAPSPAARDAGGGD